MKKTNDTSTVHFTSRLFDQTVILICFFLLVSSLQLFQTAQAQGSTGKLIAGGDDQVIIVSYKSEKVTPEVVWTWNSAESKPKKISKIVDCKSINNGKRILVISSDGEFTILNRLNKQVVFQSEVPNLKSAEQLPKGYVITISEHAGQYSTNLFHLHKGPQAIFTDTTLAAQALTWDESRNQIWVTGDQKLKQLKVTKQNELVVQKEWKLPIDLEAHSEMVTEGDYLYIKGKQNTIAFHLPTFTFKDQLIPAASPNQLNDEKPDAPLELSQLPSYEKLLTAPYMSYRFQNMTIKRVRKF
jgi:hypothetical protein